MNKQDEGYNGPWKTIGCTLVIILALVFLWIVFTIIKMSF